MARKATPEEADIIHGILHRMTMDENSTVVAFAGGDWHEAKRLAYALGGYRPNSSCNACRIKMMDILRSAVGLGVARRIKPSLAADRLAICHACPVFRSSTGSCGRLIIDAIKPQPVLVDGEEVLPCGCVVALKVQFPTEQCPAKRWPK